MGNICRSPTAQGVFRQRVVQAGLQHSVRICIDPVVPHPYYGSYPDFERVLDLVEDACDGLLVHVQKRLATLN